MQLTGRARLSAQLIGAAQIAVTRTVAASPCYAAAEKCKVHMRVWPPHQSLVKHIFLFFYNKMMPKPDASQHSPLCVAKQPVRQILFHTKPFTQSCFLWCMCQHLLLGAKQQPHLLGNNNIHTLLHAKQQLMDANPYFFFPVVQWRTLPRGKQQPHLVRNAESWVVCTSPLHYILQESFLTIVGGEHGDLLSWVTH